MSIVVVYSVNKSFVLPCAVSLRSLVRSFEESQQSIGHSLRIVIFHNDTLGSEDIANLRLCARSELRDCTLEVRPFNFPIPALLCDAPQWNNIETVATLIIPSLLEEVPRAIFLDADTLVVGDIFDLWQLDLDGKPCACVPDFDGTSPNTGVIVYDVQEWVRRDLTRKCLDYVSTNRTFHVDQEPFTQVPGAEFHRLPLRWNYHGVDTWMFKRHGGNLPEPDLRIVHFNGPPRPWYRGSPRQYADVWQRYFAQTPYGREELPSHGMRDFWAFRISPLEEWLANAAKTSKRWLLPYVAVRRLRMTYHYAKYRSAVG